VPEELDIASIIATSRRLLAGEETGAAAPASVAKPSPAISPPASDDIGGILSKSLSLIGEKDTAKLIEAAADERRAIEYRKTLMAAPVGTISERLPEGTPKSIVKTIEDMGRSAMGNFYATIEDTASGIMRLAQNSPDTALVVDGLGLPCVVPERCFPESLWVEPSASAAS